MFLSREKGKKAGLILLWQASVSKKFLFLKFRIFNFLTDNFFYFNVHLKSPLEKNFI